MTAYSARAEEDIVSTAKAFVQQAAAHADQWEGPTTGPKAQTTKTIICVNADSRNGGVKGVADGIAEAAKTIGWNSRIIDGRGEVLGYEVCEGIIRKLSARPSLSNRRES